MNPELMDLGQAKNFSTKSGGGQQRIFFSLPPTKKNAGNKGPYFFMPKHFEEKTPSLTNFFLKWSLTLKTKSCPVWGHLGCVRQGEE